MSRYPLGLNPSPPGSPGQTKRAPGETTAPFFSFESAALHWEATARRYQEVQDRSPDGMMIFRSMRDPTGHIVDFEWLYVNSSAGDIVGRRPEDLLGKRLLVEMPGNRAEGLFDIYVQVVERGEPHAHEFSYRHEGLDKWFRATSIKLDDGFYVAFLDLTVRKRAEEQAGRLAAIVRSSEHAIYSVSLEGTVETWNQGAERLYGYTGAEMVGQSILAIIPHHLRAEREATFRRQPSSGVESFEAERLTKAGAIVHVSVTSSPITDPDGRSGGSAVIARDLSQQINLQERLVIADRMVSVGTLAAGMAHEINNPLAYVTANLDIVLEELQAIGGGSPSSRIKDLEGMLLEARGGSERIRKLVRELMTFSRPEAERRAVIEVRPVIELAISMAFNEIRHRARLVKDYGAIPPVFADDARLGQVFINLLVNAAQSIAEGNVEDNEIRIVTSTDEAGRAVMEVRDTGRGIPGAVIARIFDPFFTTKALGVGTGLGLSICHNIVSGMGGEITARNNQAGGATFRVTLPASAPAAAPDPVVTGKVVAAPRRGAVLIVDDEPAVGIILARVLRDHDVTLLTRAKEAIDLVVGGKHFDVIISDLMMPEMSGIDLYDELTRRQPEAAQRMVFISGGAFTKGASAFLDRVANERLEKPFETAKVRALVGRFVKG
jgi:PAS domain S-box-containing protein